MKNWPDADFGFLKTPSVVQMAEEILRLHDRSERLYAAEAELEELRKKYDEVLMSGIRHGEKMMGGLLQLAMKPGVLDAISEANKAEQTT